MDTGYAGMRSPAIRAEPWQLLTPALEWNELVLAERELDVLRAVAVGLSRHEPAVARRAPADALSHDIEAPAPGFRLLLTGPPGIGKTMAARALGGELDRPILRVEIADLLPEMRVEAQRLVTQLFIAAEDADAIPFLVASYSWLGERRRAMGHYERRIAFEVSGLYEYVEQYPGLIIFAGRPAREADDLPAKHFDFEIEFAIPGEADRRRIWRSSLPRDANLPRSTLGHVASAFELAGGTIKDCCADAAALAQRARRPVDLDDVACALEQYYGPLPDERTRGALLELRAMAPAEAPPVETVRPAPPEPSVRAIRERPEPASRRPRPLDSPLESRRARPATVAQRRWAALLGAIAAAAALGFTVAGLTGGGQPRPKSQPHSATTAPRPSASYAAALNVVIGRLNKRRASEGLALRSARTAQEQSRAAAALADAHAAAASALRRLSAAGVAQGANASLGSALATTADAYRVLARSAATGDARGYQQAEASLARAAVTLNSAFAALRRLGYSVS